MFPLPLHIYFEIAALLASILLWRSLKDTRLRWFLPFLLFIVLAEISGRFMYKELKQPNAWLYNLVVPAEYLFYSTLFLLHYKKNVNRLIVKLFLILFTVYTCISLLFINGIYTFNINFLLAGSLCMTIFCLLYLFEQYFYQGEESIWQTPMFWITIGILLFNTGEFSYNLLSRYLIDNDMDPSLKFFRSINNKLILVLYSSFIIAFICQKITGKYKKV